ncbi:MAG: GGDEF domain-containing protein [Ectothiorhodospiraceae bacterium]|nr:GGDEF domain-containing protein [Ectothiorhodospiraceae bacterium]
MAEGYGVDTAFGESAISKPALSRWTGEFRDKATEKEYRNKYTHQTLKEAQFGLWVWAVLWLAFTANDYVLLGASPGYFMLLAMRGIVSACLLGLIWLMWRKPVLLTDGYGLMTVSLIAWAGYCLLYFLYPEDNLRTLLAVSIVLLVGLFVFIPNRVSTATVVAVFTVNGTVVSVRWIHDTPPALMLAIALIMLVPAATGLVVARRFQAAQRMMYALLVETQQANTLLEQEIRSRRELENELKRQATTDPLTGLHNRRSFEKHFHREMRRTRRTGNPLSLVVLDLARFKKVNDSYGHNVGDEALRSLARLLADEIREPDVCGRLGGEEFVVLLTEAGKDQALLVAERLRTRIADTPINANGHQLHLTVTAGVAELLPWEDELAMLVQRADEALYAGKSAGRNCVRLAAEAG